MPADFTLPGDHTHTEGQIADLTTDLSDARSQIDANGTTLGIGTIADGDTLIRSGTDVVGSRGPLLYRDVQFTNAQVIHLPTTPVIAIPAPGTGLALVAGCTLGRGDVAILLDWHADYGNLDADMTIRFQVGTNGPYCSYGGTGDPLQSVLAWTAGGALNPFWVPAPGQVITQGQANNSASDIDNQPLYVSFENGALNDLSGGNASNKLCLRIWYSLMPTVPFGA